MTLYVALRNASVPVATFCEVVESVTGPLHEPLPPDTVALVHVTFTAETGTVEQPGKLALWACTLSDQDAGIMLRPFQVTVAAVLAPSNGESGSVPWKLIVPGVAVMLLTEIANFGCIVRGFGGTRAGGPAAARNASNVVAQAAMAVDLVFAG